MSPAALGWPGGAGGGARPWREILRGGAWVAAGHALAAAGVLLGFRLLTEALSPAVFGVLGLHMGLAALARSVFCFPLLQASLRHYPLAARGGGLAAFGRVLRGELLRGAAAACAAVALLGAAAGRFLGASAASLALLAAFVALDTLRIFEADLWNAAFRQRRYALWSVAEAWARPLSGVAAAYLLAPTPESVLLGYVGAEAALALLLRVSSALPPRPAGGDAEAEARLRDDVRRYARPLAPLALVAWVSMLGDRYVVGAALGVERVGLYAAAHGLMSMLFQQAHAVLEAGLRPVYFDAVAGGDRGQERRLFAAWAGATVLIGLAIVGAVAALHGGIARVLLGERFREASSLMPWIAAGQALLTLSWVFEKACYAHGRTRRVLAAEAAGAGAFVVVAPALVWSAGLRGAAMAGPAYFGIQLVAAVAAARRVWRESHPAPA